jgi:hypothetical protein
MKSGIDVIRFTLHQFLVGAASSRKKKSLYNHNCIIAAGLTPDTVKPNYTDSLILLRALAAIRFG